MAPEPVYSVLSQVPGSAVSAEVSINVPDGAAGAVRFAGGCPTANDAAGIADCVPSTLVAVTITLTVLPTSAPVSVYVFAIAPVMS